MLVGSIIFLGWMVAVRSASEECEVYKGKICFLCEDAIERFRSQAVGTEFQHQVEDYMKQLCLRSEDSEFSKACTCFVEEELGLVLKKLAGAPAVHSLCQIVDVCPSSMKWHHHTNGTDSTCDTCKDLVSSVGGMFGKQFFKKPLNVLVRQACLAAPVFKEKCANEMMLYLDELLESAKGTAPGIFCKMVHLCQ
ncbi:unnamed protein product [Calicophoron daubneyi]|uniref:Saposin B-type domain-containing protein n=1 Tax=Calicophoron daubneyi TaxID=300641 RepID=A0AAV2TMU8_CALDB